MEFLLTSNILEHEGLPRFVKAASMELGIPFIVTGDLLNIFPEPGEDLNGSIFAELYGDMIVPNMDWLVQTRFKKIGESAFIEPLREMFLPTGKSYKKASLIALKRYQKFFNQIEDVLGDNQFYYIPGNMDYPEWSRMCTHESKKIHQLDNEILEIDGVKIAGLGGIPNNVGPFKAYTEISPYEMAEAEYVRRLNHLWGADVLLTHLSVGECEPLAKFVRESPLKILINRAPFDFNRDSDFRGKLQVQEYAGKHVIHVRPFDFPENTAMRVHLSLENLAECKVDYWTWKDSSKDPSGPGKESHSRAEFR